jgi:hypothetical protein
LFVVSKQYLVGAAVMLVAFATVGAAVVLVTFAGGKVGE